MNLSLAIPLLTLVVGLLLYFVFPIQGAKPSHSKISEVGRLLFFVGVFWLVYTFAGTTLRIHT